MTAFNEIYNEAYRLALCGDYEAACELYERLNAPANNPEQRANVANDLGTIAALRGEIPQAQRHFEMALSNHSDSVAARQNLKMLSENVF